MCDCPLALYSAVCHKISLQLTKHHLITALALASLPPAPTAVLPLCHDIWTINNLMSTEYFINSDINIFHSLRFSLQVLGRMLTVEEVFVGQCRPVLILLRTKLTLTLARGLKGSQTGQA